MVINLAGRRNLFSGKMPSTCTIRYHGEFLGISKISFSPSSFRRTFFFLLFSLGTALSCKAVIAAQELPYPTPYAGKPPESQKNLTKQLWGSLQQEKTPPQLKIKAHWEFAANKVFLVSTLAIPTAYHLNRELLRVGLQGLTAAQKQMNKDSTGFSKEFYEESQAAILRLTPLDDPAHIWPPISGQAQGIRYYSETVEFRQELKLESIVQPSLLQAISGKTLELELLYQLCDDDAVCFLPVRQNYRIELPSYTREEEYSSESAADSTALFWQILKTGASPNSTGNNLWQQLGILLLSLLSGIVLNLMPCIFPIFSLKLQKILRLLQETSGTGQELKASYRRAGNSLFYTLLGIELSFLVLALLLFAVSNKAQGVLWGFQLQQPVLVYAFLLLLFLMSLSLLGIFQLQTPKFFWTLLQKTQNNMGSSKNSLSIFRATHEQIPANRQSSAIGNAVQDTAHGALIVLLGTPCSAPLLAPLLGFLLLQSQIGLNLAGVFLIGLGLWLPYALLFWLGKPNKTGILRKSRLQSAILRLQQNMPLIEQILGFVMLGASVYFYSILLSLLDPAVNRPSWILASLLILAFTAWLWQSAQKAQLQRPSQCKILAIAHFCSLGLSIACILYLGKSFADQSNTTSSASSKTSQAATSRNISEIFQTPEEQWPQFWTYYASAAEQDILQQLQKQGYGIFIEYTAAWCITCKFNQARLLHRDSFTQLLQKHQTLYLKADLTKPQPLLEKELNFRGRASLPLYLLFPPSAQHQVKILPIFPSYQDFVKELQN